MQVDFSSLSRISPLLSGFLFDLHVAEVQHELQVSLYTLLLRSKDQDISGSLWSHQRQHTKRDNSTINRQKHLLHFSLAMQSVSMTDLRSQRSYNKT